MAAILARGGVTRKYARALVGLFVVSLLFSNPHVGGDGVGYYAYVRSLLIDGDLHFENEMVAGGLMEAGDSAWYTSTGYVGNGWAPGASILWAPWITAAHLGALSLNGLGLDLTTDGYSWPYQLALAWASALYGFLSLYLSFRLAREYVSERWAFWGALGIWSGTGLPVYMYYHPSYSHAASAFLTTVFLVFWHSARTSPTLRQQVTLGLLSGLMLNTYYPNVVFLLLPASDALRRYRDARQSTPDRSTGAGLLMRHDAAYVLSTVMAFLPTLLTRSILYGHPLESGYPAASSWNWTSPALGRVLLSANHGLFSWTPVLIPATFGLLALRRWAPTLASRLLVVCAAFYYLIAAYPHWHGASSFGNRFFVSLTPVFVLGLAAALTWLERQRGPGFALRTTATVVALLGAWNLGLFIQWATGKIPDQGPVSWRQVGYQQVVTVPATFARHFYNYTRKRGALLTQPAEPPRDKSAAPDVRVR